MTVGFTLALYLAGCGFEITLTEDQHPGILFVEVVDESNQCLKPVHLEFRFPDETVSNGVHGDLCEFGTSGPPGTWEIRISGAQQYRLRAEDDPFLVDVLKDEVKRVRIALVESP